MQAFDFLNLYVADPIASGAFYAQLLGRPPVQMAPTYAMFSFDNKVTLGLWRSDDVKPDCAPGGASNEVSFVVADRDAVDAAHAYWVSRGWHVALAPEQLAFAYTAMVLDPDGHRIRVMRLGQ